MISFGLFVEASLHFFIVQCVRQLHTFGSGLDPKPSQIEILIDNFYTSGRLSRTFQMYIQFDVEIWVCSLSKRDYYVGDIVSRILPEIVN